ncbi:MAG: hypothetical protein DRI90_09085 [Deltaproteobacteria bacterium]|nr:MAG: hypothetical protein DRI90_09085 [Deltaproteobacteria bacterium]
MAAGRATEKGVGTKAEPADAYDLYRRAVELNREACEQDEDHRACSALGGLLREGRGTAEDPTRGLALQQIACRAGHATGCIAWASRGRKLVLGGADLGMADVLVDACVKGDGPACLVLGRIGSLPFLQAGKEAPDIDAFARGCDAGNGACCNALGIRTFPLEQEGRRALERACKLGDAPGCYHLGIVVAQPGDGQDTARATGLFMQACAWRFGPACGRQGVRLSRGEELPLDLDEAQKLWRRGCQLGDGFSCFKQGSLLQDGRAVTADPAQGQRHLEHACRLGEQQACTRLGHRLLAGRGVTKDIVEGSGMLHRACRAGYGRACADLAAILRYGRGVPVDEPRARKLLRQAVPDALEACEASLALCYDKQPLVDVVRGWGRWAGAPAKLVVQHPSCDDRLERACRDAGEALAARCDMTGLGCFAGARLRRRLAAVGLEGGTQGAETLEKAGFAAATKACLQKDAAGCRRLSLAYDKGLGTRQSPLLADHYRSRACQLDPKTCAK